MPALVPIWLSDAKETLDEWCLRRVQKRLQRLAGHGTMRVHGLSEKDLGRPLLFLKKALHRHTYTVETECYLVMGVTMVHSTRMFRVRGLWTGSRSGGSEALLRCLSQPRRPRCGAACSYILVYVLEAT